MVVRYVLHNETVTFVICGRVSLLCTVMLTNLLELLRVVSGVTP